MPPANVISTFELTKEEFQSLLAPCLGADVKVEDFKTRALTQPGENYGSTILSAELNLKQGLRRYKLPLVVKLVPPSEYLCEIFDIEITFNKEVNAYKCVSPQYEQIQREKKVTSDNFLDIFPKFYGARTNQQGKLNEKADHTAVLLLENLKLSGYHTGDRLKGLDLQHVKLVISQLARFHATSVAIKLTKPIIFKETVLKACESFVLDGISNDDVAEKIIKCNLDDVRRIDECVPYLNNIEAALLYLKNHLLLSYITTFGVNNMMFKYDQYSVPICMKFVDFQTTIYSSPVRDLIFFLYSSADDNVIENHFDDMIVLYHQEFIKCLSCLGCDTRVFSFENFQEELNIFAPKEFAHILCMVKFITADKNKVPDLSNCDLDVIVQDNYGGELYEKRVKLLIKDFLKKGWL
ncbi:hypothetical protein L9F63_027026 [Diploptera punctata]|uniref:CHK kinase-like domain-containing protein n=1 Tax=Diploptera punctata TaxID=6984 RepID=A0AAD8AFY4_DIPPU|nr:hypothetical protein L9F63_027026 [Diploptera punctata]